MDNGTPIIFLPIASGASSDSEDVNTSIILMPHGQSFTTYQPVRAFASHVEGWVYVIKFKLRQTYMYCKSFKQIVTDTLLNAR